MKLIWGEVTELVRSDRQVSELIVSTEHSDAIPCLAFERLTGTIAQGMRVLINTSALDLELGTGGFAFVVAKAEEPGALNLNDASGGHIMKMRYSPLQRDVLSIEEQDAPFHDIMRQAYSLEGMPVVCCGLHSQLPLVAAAIKKHQSELKVAYIMTDQAALPAELSLVLAKLREEGLIDHSISVGQAFGAEYEAVTLHSGLLAAKHALTCDIAIVAIGPGVVGTATPFGHGGIAQGEALNAVTALQGKAIAVLRMSEADERPRHQNISHHSRSALADICLSPVIVALPALEKPALQVAVDNLREACLNTGIPKEHLFMDASESRYDEAALKGIVVKTMRRGYEADPLFFEAAWAAGFLAQKLCEASTN